MSKPTLFKTLLIYSLGFFVRLVLLNSTALSEILGNRVEISTPISSWKKAVEGVNLWKRGTNPYDSDIFHENPLMLISYEFILSNFSRWIPVIFAICDVLTAAALSFAAHIYLKDTMKREKSSAYQKSAASLLLKREDLAWVPFYVATLYLLCPFSVISCGGKSTVTFQNLFLALFLLCTVAGQWLIGSILLAVLSCHSLYHAALLVPFVMYTHQKAADRKGSLCDILRILTAIATFLAATGSLIFAFREITGSWQFLWSTYGCILSVPDLTPNIGLFWYFFTEMFEHFRIFFLCTFQLNVFIYTAPLTIRLRKEPIFCLFVHLVIISIFKSYPCLGDFAFYFALLPLWSHLFHFMRQRFLVCCVLASCTLLAPTLWHLWIYSGSANANFYFAITLAFNTGQVFLLTDILSAYIKREYYLENGVKYNEDGTLLLMRLQ